MLDMNSFVCGDCMDYLPIFPDNYFDLAVTDPPYGIGEHGGMKRSKYVAQKNGSKIFVPDGQYEKRDWDNKPPDSRYFDELKRVSKHQIIWGVNYFDYYFGSGRIIWDKCNGDSSFSDCEIAYCSMHDSVRLFRYMWNGMMQGKSIEEGHVQQGNKKLNEKRIHPTQKPVNLYRWIVQKYIKRGWKILDTHVGSASSLIAYEEYGIDYVGFEKDSYYYGLAGKRLQEHRSQLTIFDFGIDRMTV